MRIMEFVILVTLAVPASASAPAVRFAVVSDQTGSAMPGVYDSVLAEVARMDPDFVVTVGDQIEGYVGSDTASLREEYAALFAQYDRAFGPRWREDDFLILTPGNHDITDDAAEPIWRELVGPVSRKVDRLGVTIFTLDNSRRSQAEGIATDQMRFLERELAGIPPERPVIVLLHLPYFDQGIWRGEEDPAHSLFVRHGVDAVLAGHWHTYVYEPHDGIEYVVCGSSGGSTAGQGLSNGEFIGFLWGTVRDGRVTVTPVSLGNIHAPDIVGFRENDAFYTFRERGVVVSPFDISMSASEITVTAHNTGDSANRDSLRWTVPENWTVSPRVAAFDAAVGDSTVESFELRYQGPPFPLPSLSAGLHIGRGKSTTTTVPLRIERTARCPRRPQIEADGRIGADEWDFSAAENLFMSPEGDASSADAAEFLFAHDDRGLYLAARCHVQPGHAVVAEVTGRDGPVHREDCVGWFLSPADSVLYQIYVNPNGVIFDGRGSVGPDGPDMRYDWDGDYEVASRRAEDHWTIELHVPFETIGVTGAHPPSRLRLNMRRKQRSLETAADWMPVGFDPAFMGWLDLGR